VNTNVPDFVDKEDILDSCQSAIASIIRIVNDNLLQGIFPPKGTQIQHKMKVATKLN